MARRKVLRLVTLVQAILIIVAATCVTWDSIWLNVANIALLKLDFVTALNSLGRIGYFPQLQRQRTLYRRATILRAEGNLEAARQVIIAAHSEYPDDELIRRETVRLAGATGRVNAISLVSARYEQIGSNTAGGLVNAALRQPMQVSNDTLSAWISSTFRLNTAPKYMKQLPAQIIAGTPGEVPKPVLARSLEALAWLELPLSSLKENVTPLDVQPIANALRVQPSQIVLGDNLVRNGSFEEIDYDLRRPKYWTAYFWVGDRYQDGSYLVGGDSAIASHGSNALRIVGIAAEQNGKGESSRAGAAQAAIMLEPHRLVVAVFDYRTDPDFTGVASVHFADDPNVFFVEVPFPPTHGQWKRLYLMAHNRIDQPRSVVPMFRVWGEGTLWIDHVSLRQTLTPEVSLGDPLIVSVDLAPQ